MGRPFFIVRGKGIRMLGNEYAVPNMQPDEDSLTTLSKWPFILGDVLLVATALAIAILGDWQLTNWQVASCVISVALGAGLFVLPYVVEFQVRLREEREDRGAELRILHKHVVNGREDLESAGERIEAVEVALNNIDQSTPDLSGLIEALEKKLDKKLEPMGGQHLQLSEQIGAVSKQVDVLSAKLKEKLDAKSLKAVEADLSSLKNELAELPAKLPKPLAPSKEEPESRLLKRAIDQKQDKSSAAVSRIIESKQKDEAPKEEAKKPAPEPEKKPEPKPESKPEPKVEKKPEPKVEKKAEPKVEKKAEPKPEPKVEKKPEPAPKEEVKEVAKPKVVSEEPPVPSPEPKEKVAKPVAKKEAPKPAKVEKAEPKEAPEQEPEKKQVPEEKEAPKPKAESKPEPEEPADAAESSEDMFGEAVPAQVKKRARTKKSDTAVIASVFIGIGNKPYLRGSGAGLNWDSGVEMEFEEIGRWRWIAPADLEGPIEIQLYRNDEDADSTGKYALEPGQQLDLSPVF